MMKTVIFPAIMLFGITLHAQQEKPARKSITDVLGIDTESIKKDLKGNVISNQQFTDSLNTGKYVTEKVKQDQKVIETKLKIASAPQSMMLKSMLDGLNFKPRTAPDFDAVDINGKHYKLADLKDKTVVLNFWFKECVPCINEMPALNELVKTNKNVVFIAFTPNKKSDVQAFLEKKPFHYNIIPNALDVITKYEISAFPGHSVIKNGIMTHKFSGDNAIKELQDAINEK